MHEGPTFQSPRAGMTGRSSHTPRILLVDDNATNLQVLYQTLDGQGYRLLAARSGRDALAIAARTSSLLSGTSLAFLPITTTSTSSGRFSLA